MKRAINYKIYDTSTAKKIGEWDNGLPLDDLSYCSESLYRKKTGEFFLYLYGESGASGKYAVRRNYVGGKKIIPLAYEEARQWAEKHLTGDEYIGIFGEPEKDNSKTILSAYVPKDLCERIKQKASQNGKTISEQVSELLTSVIG